MKDLLTIGGTKLHSRLFLGTGKFSANTLIEPYCLLRTPRMAGTIKPGGVDNERKTI